MDKYALGNFLAELRAEKGLTQEQLAEMINVNYKTISKWECGNSLPSLDTITQLAEIYNVSLYEMSIYKKIKNPFISKDNIKKVINKQSITKFILIKIILLLFTIISIIFITYSCIYTVNNYNKMKVYELTNENNDLSITGLFIKTHNNYYLSISKIKYLSHNDEQVNDKTKKIQYAIIINNKIIENGDILFEKETKISDAIASIKLYISDKKLTYDINNFNLSIKYENEKGINENKIFKIILSKKQSNNKLFY